MVKTYLFLAGAVLFEVAGTMLLPVTQNFTKLIPTAGLAFFYLCAFYLLTFVADKIPIAIMYATWSCLLYTSPSPRDLSTSRMPSSA